VLLPLYAVRPCAADVQGVLTVAVSGSLILPHPVKVAGRGKISKAPNECCSHGTRVKEVARIIGT